MAISNYGELKAELSRYLFNQRFVADYDDYTTMFEADANSRLRVLPMETCGLADHRRRRGGPAGRLSTLAHGAADRASPHPPPSAL